ncbi:small multi-drug export protein [Virgibacillus sp. NKC19-3]|uniref:small multi-drug export protein n=1 Tax=Virgibacillus saliphilus TaxID=2831674 RepID=UPI001C9B8298|nr:small multi-drug export protein [Virgibacillus sp. NKC19-3]MBY7141979.1 small multi-drug export protein [Virgibacillus sp. NKC19-3]
MLNYLLLAVTAWFMGFFPMFEIYIAIPVSMAMGLDTISSIVWAGLGNFLPVPLIAFFYRLLAKSERIKNWLEKLTNSKYKNRIEKQGPLVVLLLTPIIGSWAVAVIANGIGMNKTKLFISAGGSILLYGIILAVLTHLGIDVVS